MLRVDLTADRFSATFCQPVAPFAEGAVLYGRHARAEGHVLTTVLVRGPDSPIRNI